MWSSHRQRLPAASRPGIEVLPQGWQGFSEAASPCNHAAAVPHWHPSAGIVSPKVTQAYFGELRGAAAVEDIAPDEVFVTVPRAAALVVAPNERCPCPDFVDPGGCRLRQPKCRRQLAVMRSCKGPLQAALSWHGRCQRKQRPGVLTRCALAR